MTDGVAPEEVEALEPSPLEFLERSNWPTSICRQRLWLASKSGKGPPEINGAELSVDFFCQAGGGGVTTWPRVRGMLGKIGLGGLSSEASEGGGVVCGAPDEAVVGLVGGLGGARLAGLALAGVESGLAGGAELAPARGGLIGMGTGTGPSASGGGKGMVGALGGKGGVDGWPVGPSDGTVWSS
jgi:hypothetical protein